MITSPRFSTILWEDKTRQIHNNQTYPRLKMQHAKTLETDVSATDYVELFGHSVVYSSNKSPESYYLVIQIPYIFDINM